MITRRELLRAIALGGGIVAGELWVPGARKIFIPRAPEVFWDLGNDDYTGMSLLIMDGVGKGQVRVIDSYDRTRAIAIPSAAWAIQPDATSVYQIF